MDAGKGQMLALAPVPSTPRALAPCPLQHELLQFIRPQDGAPHCHTEEPIVGRQRLSIERCVGDRNRDDDDLQNEGQADGSPEQRGVKQAVERAAVLRA